MDNPWRSIFTGVKLITSCWGACTHTLTVCSVYANFHEISVKRNITFLQRYFEQEFILLYHLRNRNMAVEYNELSGKNLHPSYLPENPIASHASLQKVLLKHRLVKKVPDSGSGYLGWDRTTNVLFFRQIFYHWNTKEPDAIAGTNNLSFV